LSNTARRDLTDGSKIRPVMMIALLAAIAAVAAAAFMTVGVQGSWSFILPFRGQKLAGLILVGYAIAVSTVLFQTLTENRILTPSIMGFEAVYVLIQTLLAVVVGPARTNAIDPHLRFTAETVLMITASVALYRWLFAGGKRDLHRLALAGLVFGALLRSLSGFLQRILDPSEFAVLQDRLFASFNLVNADLLLIAAAAVLAVSIVGWRMLHTFDVLALGREAAIGLGVEYRRTVMIILILIAVLISVSTALVGPVTFFGLLVSTLARALVGDGRHALVLPAAVLLAAICLIGGQIMLERMFGFNTSLSIVIEFFGGIAFIFLVTRGAR
jgi:iron complex transport system permease protein